MPKTILITTLIIISIFRVLKMASVVIVDDSVFLADKIKAFLEAEGHEVLGVDEDGNEGFALYKEHKPDFITLDITMPVRDGQECLEDILEYDESASAIVVSAIDDKAIILDCMTTGAKGFIEKPLKFSNDDFCTVFREAIEAALH